MHWVHLLSGKWKTTLLISNAVQNTDLFTNTLIVKWILRVPPKNQVQVRFLLRVPLFKGLNHISRCDFFLFLLINSGILLIRFLCNHIFTFSCCEVFTTFYHQNRIFLIVFANQYRLFANSRN